VPGGIAGSPCLRGSQILRPGPPGWRLGVGFTATASKNPVVGKPKEGYGLRGVAVRNMMMMMMMMMMIVCLLYYRSVRTRFMKCFASTSLWALANCRHGDVSLGRTVRACYQYGWLIEGHAPIDIHLQTEMTSSSEEVVCCTVVVYHFFKAGYCFNLVLTAEICDVTKNGTSNVKFLPSVNCHWLN
jgi:hypothetical protein